MTLVQDPRWIEYQAAHAATREGLAGTGDPHERYRQAIGAYCTLLAEQCGQNGRLRVFQMEALVRRGLPLGVIAVAFKATVEELEEVKNLPPLYPDEDGAELSQEAYLRSLPYSLYLKTDHWKHVRDAALKRAKNRCALCNSDRRLQVHHRTYDRRGRERASDVVVLCDGCHGRHHGVLKVA